MKKKSAYTQRIAAEREHFKLSQEELAERINVPVGEIQKLEKNGSGRVTTLLKIADYFRQPLDYLVGNAAPAPTPETVSPFANKGNMVNGKLDVQKKIFVKAGIPDTSAQDAPAPPKAVKTKTRRTAKAKEPWKNGYLGKLDISSRAKHILYKNNIRTEKKLAALSDNEFSHMEGLGSRTRAEVLDVWQALQSGGED